MKTLELTVAQDLDDVRNGIRTSPYIGVPRYASMIDIPSLVDYYLVTEFNKDIDGFKLSNFFWKDAQGKLYAGPMWDYGNSWGLANYFTANDSTGYMRIADAPYYLEWVGALFNDSYFAVRVAARWLELRRPNGPIQNTTIFANIDYNVANIQAAVTRNFAKWQILGKYVWPESDPIPTTFQGEIMKLKDWINARLVWLDANLPLLDQWSHGQSVCGNGIVEGNEECDSLSPCCNIATCKFVSAGLLCFNATQPCQISQYCLGNTDFCPQNVVDMNCTKGAICGDGIVEGNEQCDSNNTCCDQTKCKFRKGTYLCAHALNNCEEDSYCSGFSELCPAPVSVSHCTVHTSTKLGGHIANNSPSSNFGSYFLVAFIVLISSAFIYFAPNYFNTRAAAAATSDRN